MKLYVSNKKETPRMFQNNALEFFSHVHWTVPLIIFIPVNAAFLYFGTVNFSVPFNTVIALFVLGMFVWTFTEYVLHRFVFHYHAKHEWSRKLFWSFHGVHHDYPSDPLRLVMVPSVSIPLAATFYFLFVFIMGWVYAAAFTPGFLTAYLFYDMTHYAVHHFPIKGPLFGYLRTYHMRHHYNAPDLGYGVSSPLWDVVFRTTFHKITR